MSGLDSVRAGIQACRRSARGLCLKEARAQHVLLGRFHELSIPTEDIRASIAFYEALGFAQAPTGEAWPHPYAVMSDGRITLGLHQKPEWQLSLTYVHERIPRYAAVLEERGLKPEFVHLGDDRFNELGVREPSGQLLRFVEARTYSPVRPLGRASLCGHFAHLSLPVSDPGPAQRFWESFGFVALEPCADPYPYLPLTSDGLNVALHEPRWAREPMLVFLDEAADARVEQLKARDLALCARVPSASRSSGSALLEAPEGTLLFLADDAA